MAIGVVGRGGGGGTGAGGGTGLVFFGFGAGFGPSRGIRLPSRENDRRIKGRYREARGELAKCCIRRRITREGGKGQWHGLHSLLFLCWWALSHSLLKRYGKIYSVEEASDMTLLIILALPELLFVGFVVVWYVATIGERGREL